MMINVLVLGEIVGRAGIQTLKKLLPEVKKEYAVDYTIANGEGTTNGFGLGKAHALQLQKIGVNLIMGGEKIFFKQDMVEFLSKTNFILRPANFPQETPGRGLKHVQLGDRTFCFINLIGNSELPRISVQNAFSAAKSLMTKLKDDGEIPFVVFHAVPTAEKATMAHFLSTDAAAVIGTHTKVMSADAFIIGGRTACISDNGRVGAKFSVGGFNPGEEIKKFMTGLPLRSQESWNGGMLNGVVVSVDTETGCATKIIPITKETEIERPAQVNKE
jgi:Uncharacterized protein conserved in bacteria